MFSQCLCRASETGVREGGTPHGIGELRRDHRRRRAQRAGRGRLSGQARREDACPRGARAGRRRGDHRIALAGRAGIQGDPAVLRDVAAAPDDHARPGAGEARLQGLPDGPVLPGVPRGRLADPVRGGLAAQPRRDRPLVEEGRGRLPEVGRLARRAGRRARPATADRAARDRLAQAEGPGRHAAAGLAAPRPRRAHGRRRDPADDDVHRRPARRLVRTRRRSRARSRSTA